MIQQSKAKIYLAANRGHHENELFRSLDTFTTGKDITLQASPFGGLYSLSDETLAPGSSVKVKAEEDALLLLLPIVGSLAVHTSNSNEKIIAPGQLMSFTIKESAAIKVSNPYNEGLINYLQIWLKQKSNDDSSEVMYSFDLNEHIDHLTEICNRNSESFTLSIGKFHGRREVIHELKGQEGFAFVIEGAFEINGRLLHARDALAIWDTGEIEAEALSNHAILLLVTMTS